MRDEDIADAAFGRTAFQGRIGFCGPSFPAQDSLILTHFLRSTGVHLIGKCSRVHDRAILTYLYARRRIGVAVKGDHYRLREPLPPEAEEVLTPFRNFVRFVEAKRDGVKYDPNQPRVPAGNPDGGQWTAEGGNIGRSAESSKEPRTRNVRLAMDITGFTKHGINQAINRGVSPSGILDAIKNPISVEPRSNGSTRHV